MCEESALYFPVARLIGNSGFGDYFGHIDDAASDNIHEVIYMGSGLMCNDSAVCGRRMDLKIVVRDLSKRRKSPHSESVMVF